MIPWGHVLAIIAFMAISLVVSCMIVFLVITFAIHYAKIACALFFALVLNTSTPILNGGGFVSYLIWAAILMGIVFVLGLVPRLNCAFLFSCTLFISYLCIEIVTNVLFGIISLFSHTSFQFPLAVEIINKVLCTVITYGILASSSCGIGKNIFQNPIIINIERLAASVIYSFAIFFVISNVIADAPDIVDLIIFFGTIAITFFLDLFLTK